MQDVILSVSDCLAFINQTLEYAYPSVVIEGEVASFKQSRDKYIFFDIKDEQAALSCFMMAYQLRVPLEDGMRVQVVARPGLTAWGKFSLTVREVRPVGQGSIKRSFELLKAKLQAEGLFDASRKRPLPSLPQRVGVVASVESAGYGDFIKIVGERWGGLELEVANVQVQGAGASAQVARALQHFNEQAEPVEVVVIIRGGGSADDLAIFNEEPLVRAVAASRIPTLVGVGHEVDVSLCDLAADVRAATPSNAAQLLVPDRRELVAVLQHGRQRLLQQLERRQSLVRQQVESASDRLIGRMQHRLNEQQRHLVYAQKLLANLNPTAVLQRGYALVRLHGKVLGNQDLQLGDTLLIETKQAIIQAGVEDVRKK